MPDALGVWLYGARVAEITRQRGRLRLAYTDDALGRYQLGTPVLSLSLPLRKERYTDIPVRAFIDGLLPEGESRQAVARDVGVPASDTFSLIRALGRDCAGAIVVENGNDAPPSSPMALSARRLSDEEIGALVANLREAPLGVGGRVRISLAGVQEKLLLTRLPDGSWGQPVDGTPSTHILKPEIARYPSTVENEAFCMRVANHLELPVASIDTTAINGRKLIVVERYDRVLYADGAIDRLHQEDFCQVTAVLPGQKYEEEGGPSLKRIAGILQAYAPSESLDTLLRATTLNVLLGNGDAHAKNFSLLYGPSGAIALAPLYDLMSTLFYGDDRLALFIDGVHRTDRVTANRIVNEAASWGMSRRRAVEIVADVLERAPDAVKAAADETPGLPAEITDVCTAQLTRLMSEFDAVPVV